MTTTLLQLAKRIGELLLAFVLAVLLLAIGQYGLNLSGRQVIALAANQQGSGIWSEAPFLFTPAITTYIPLATKDYDYYPALPLGAAIATPFGPCSSPSPPDGKCLDLDITCPGAGIIGSNLRVTDPTTATQKGTMIFFTGYDGSYWWGNPGSINGGILDNLRGAGFRTVEVKWPGPIYSSWLVAPNLSLAGMAKLGCRPATVVQWVYDNLHTDKALPYCATGHSNGASQLGLTLVYYGMGEILDAAVFESGPNFTRIDKSCLCDDPAYSNICYAGSESDVIDLSYGESRAAMPCYYRDESFRSAFIFDSLVNDFWRYRYANTTVSFLFGELDLSNTALNGKLYYQKLMSLSPTNVFSTTVAGTGHSITSTTLGSQVFEDTLKNTCIIP